MFSLEQDAVIRSYQQEAPVNLLGIANHYGVSVYSAPLPNGISGKLFRTAGTEHVGLEGSSGYAIFVNQDEAKVRQRFTIAHELGHFLLHRDLIGDGIEDDAFYRSALSGKIETEANKAAAEILMPWTLISKLIDQGIRSPDDLANRLKVSRTAISIQLGLPT